MKSIQIGEIQRVEQNTMFSDDKCDGTQNNHWTLKIAKKGRSLYHSHCILSLHTANISSTNQNLNIFSQRAIPV
jgi:hypothetical protein